MNRNKWIVFLILCIWFGISFVTNILGPIMPDIISTYHLSLTLASFLPFSFFLAYGIMSVPAGLLVEKIGPKATMLIAFGSTFGGTFLFALFNIYEIALTSLFIIGMGMAMLQVIINPLMRVAGGEENFAFNSVLAQLIFGAASFISPFVYTGLINGFNSTDQKTSFLLGIMKSITSESVRWSGLYWIFGFIFLLFFLIIIFLKIPKFELAEGEKTGSFKSYIYLLKNGAWVYFFGIMAYVGTEQGLANWMSQFLYTYHNVDPVKSGAAIVGLFWGLMSIGCLLGLLILRLIDSRKVLIGACVLAAVSLLLGLLGPTSVALIAFPASGFCLSVMFSIVFSLALNSEKLYHGSYSGILCSGIFGGALVPFIIGVIGDLVNLRVAMFFLLLPLAYLVYIGMTANPLINNKTISLKSLVKRK